MWRAGLMKSKYEFYKRKQASTLARNLSEQCFHFQRQQRLIQEYR